MALRDAVALLGALLLLTCACAGYTVDCNQEYTDCDNEFRKLTDEDAEYLSPSLQTQPLFTKYIPIEETTSSPRSTLKAPDLKPNKTSPKIKQKVEEPVTEETEHHEIEYKKTSVEPEPRLLNVNVEDLQNFANALHNHSEKNHNKPLLDLSDVNLDDDEDDTTVTVKEKVKDISDKFYTNLKAPFNPLTIDREEESVEDPLQEGICTDNDNILRIGERLNRGCEETCECKMGGTFDCAPRCKHPYIRRGRKLNDPLCFESPVDECCSIIACATDTKTTKVEVCRYENETYPVGSKWQIGCQQSCSCEKGSIINCQPRCKRIIPNEKCINVQDPNDPCCEVQVCDVSKDDVHEEIMDNSTSSTNTTASTSTSTTTEFQMLTSSNVKEKEKQESKTTSRPLVLAEPIGSIKVLQNNSVQVNLIHSNTSKDPVHLLLSDDGGKSYNDVLLDYSNLILNLDGGKDYILKTKETGTKFNFTITTSSLEGRSNKDSDIDVEGEEISDNKNVTEVVGCHEGGKFYAVGEEFQIGCTELCECTGPETRECAMMHCPSHVGLELMSKGCVKWAPSPPPVPPNCCPRSARCLSDGTCHYKGVAIPNWSEVPISLTGCEQRCFCENGDLDCQEICTPLPPLPPQTLRCPPKHRPAPLNISDEDCCKEWRCVPNAKPAWTIQPHTLPTVGDSPSNYVTAVAPTMPILTTPAQPSKLSSSTYTDSADFFRHFTPNKSFLKLVKPATQIVNDKPKYIKSQDGNNMGPILYNNSTVLHLNVDKPLKMTVAYPDSNVNKPLKMTVAYSNSDNHNDNWKVNSKVREETLQNLGLQMFPKSTQSTIYLPKQKKPLVVPSDDVNSHSPIREALEPKRVTPKNLLDTNYFMPVARPYYSKLPSASEVINDIDAYSEPRLNNRSQFVTSVKTKPVSQRFIDLHMPYNNRPKEISVLRNRLTESFKEDTLLHNYERNNPDETLILRAMPNTYTDLSVHKDKNLHDANAFGLENIINQMEIESEVKENLGRTAEKRGQIAAPGPLPDLPSTSPNSSNNPHQPFLPTVSPAIHFPEDPHEEIPDYDQNNLHRPVNNFEPNIPLPPGIQVPPNYGEENKKLSVLTIQADSPTSVKMLFGLPPVLVGLRGSVDLRYTDKAEEDVSLWYSQVFAPADEVLTTSRLEFRLTGLKPSTTYKIRGKLYLHNLPVEPESDVYTVRTQDLPTVPPIEEKRREIDSRLSVMDVNDTSAHLTWRHFTENELQFIDGIQVRYRPVGTPIYSMTELLHHSRSNADLHELRPGTKYEASLVLVPPPRALTELYDPGMVQFSTSPHVDPYNWTATIEARTVGAEAVELTWRGVPLPAERWVRVYRAAHACSGARKEHDSFRLATRDLPTTLTLTGLEANTRCRIWLELFLTNGKVKTSNVLEIMTKTLDSPEPIDNSIEAASVGSVGGRGSPRGDYYGALVVVGVVAALGALTSLLLLLVVVRRHRPRSVPITPVPSAPRESSLPPYDNPAYKLELQQETMDL